MKKIMSFVVLCALWSVTACAQTELVQKGQNCPDFSYQTEDGATHRLSELKGKVVLINFFATWCGPCRMELPLVQSDIWNVYHSDPRFVLLVIGREHTAAELKAFKDKQPFTFGFIPDPKREIYSKFATQSIPRNYLVDASGKVVYSSIGFSDEEFKLLLHELKTRLK